jgi:hypothetical protein
VSKVEVTPTLHALANTLSATQIHLLSSNTTRPGTLGKMPKPLLT